GETEGTEPKVVNSDEPRSECIEEDGLTKAILSWIDSLPKKASERMAKAMDSALKESLRNLEQAVVNALRKK
ncbi:MAG: cytochrome P450, partial [Candidatus Berkelbacteria bacterium]|nr:cytochrome P450 [Candidatus Berkelbacteria bacterium]